MKYPKHGASGLKKKKKKDKQYELGSTDSICLYIYQTCIYIFIYKRVFIYIYKKSMLYFSMCIFIYIYRERYKRMLDNLMILAEVFVTMENVPS